MSQHTTIGVISPQLSGEYFGTLLNGIKSVTQQCYPPLLAFEGSPHDLLASRLGWKHVVGWIVINTTHGLAELAHEGVPVVTIGALLPELQCPVVFPDNRAGMHAAVLHLIDHGHREIAFVGDLANADIEQRYHGYRTALAERGLAADPGLLFAVDDNGEGSGAMALQRLLQSGRACTAVACGTDETALGVLSAAQAAGRDVPNDLAVVGFDDIILAHTASPPLTTIRLPIHQLGITAAQLLLDRINGHPTPAGATFVATALQTRRSCGCSTNALPASTAQYHASRDWMQELALQLTRLACYPVPIETAAEVNTRWPSVTALVAGLAGVIHGTQEISALDMFRVWQQAIALTQSLETLHTMLGLLEQAGSQQLADQPHDPHAAARFAALIERARLEMMRARVASETAFIRSYSSLIHQNYEVSLALLTGQTGEARSLAWLQQTPVRWGCLGLWDVPRSDGQAVLSVAGTYCRADHEATIGTAETRIPAETFPPLMVEPADDVDIVVLRPIRSTAAQLGVLALGTQIQYLRSSGNYNALNALATQLSAALERDSLQQTVSQAYERERALAATVREIGCPVIPLFPGVILVPLIGLIDGDRSRQITEAILGGVEGLHAECVLLDITAVPLVDAQVASSLILVAQAAKLLGARTILVGVRPEIAQSMVALDLTMGHIETQPSLALALASLGKRGREPGAVLTTSVQPRPARPSSG